MRHIPRARIIVLYGYLARLGLLAVCHMGTLMAALSYRRALPVECCLAILAWFGPEPGMLHRLRMPESYTSL